MDENNEIPVENAEQEVEQIEVQPEVETPVVPEEPHVIA